MPQGHAIPNDWHPGVVPAGVVFDPSADLGSSYSFVRCRTERHGGLTVGPRAMLYGCTLDVGPRGRVVVGEHAMVTSALIQCDEFVEIGPYAMVAWGAAIMDSYRGLAADAPERAKPVRLGANCWVGFEACVLPGVRVGQGAIVGARAVVTRDVEPFTIVAGNPARVVRRLEPTVRPLP